MSGEFLKADLGGLHILAELYNRFWADPGSRTAVELAREIRLCEQRYGLSPVDRRRLQWSITRGDQAVDRTRARRKAAALDRAASKDPRDLLGLVK